MVKICLNCTLQILMAICNDTGSRISTTEYNVQFRQISMYVFLVGS